MIVWEGSPHQPVGRQRNQPAPTPLFLETLSEILLLFHLQYYLLIPLAISTGSSKLVTTSPSSNMTPGGTNIHGVKNGERPNGHHTCETTLFPHTSPPASQNDQRRPNASFARDYLQLGADLPGFFMQVARTISTSILASIDLSSYAPKQSFHRMTKKPSSATCTALSPIISILNLTAPPRKNNHFSPLSAGSFKLSPSTAPVSATANP